SLVAILDADKEGFLRSERSLIQTIGRAARNVGGQVHMYADQITPSMAAAIDETNRRRSRQIAYNAEHGIDPQPLRKKIADIADMLNREDADTEALLDGRRERGLRAKDLPQQELATLIEDLTSQMHQAAAELQFEQAARLRDEIGDLKKELRQMIEANK
ncbi:MAG: UvrB/UvrC motif-containing protein, partial [Propionibacteriaceae bacterium]|nr:UvrB/UvrC motif-containing protein [Propionibacteriaceae bacterium]